MIAPFPRRWPFFGGRMIIGINKKEKGPPAVRRPQALRIGRHESACRRRSPGLAHPRRMKTSCYSVQVTTKGPVSHEHALYRNETITDQGCGSRWPRNSRRAGVLAPTPAALARARLPRTSGLVSILGRRLGMPLLFGISLATTQSYVFLCIGCAYT